MLIGKEDAIKLENGKACTVWEYFLDSEKVGIAKAELNGRYPEMGLAMNKECDQIYFCISGKGTIHYDGKTFELREGGAFLFKKGHRYWLECDNLIVLVANGPPFRPEQYEITK